MATTPFSSLHLSVFESICLSAKKKKKYMQKKTGEKKHLLQNVPVVEAFARSHWLSVFIATRVHTPKRTHARCDHRVPNAIAEHETVIVGMCSAAPQARWWRRHWRRRRRFLTGRDENSSRVRKAISRTIAYACISHTGTDRVVLLTIIVLWLQLIIANYSCFNSIPNTVFQMTFEYR